MTLLQQIFTFIDTAPLFTLVVYVWLIVCIIAIPVIGYMTAPERDDWD